jgi:opacity protein-like surface antigen
MEEGSSAAAPAPVLLAQAQPLANLAGEPADMSGSPPATPALLGQMVSARDASRRNQISFGYRFGVNGTVEFKGFALPPRRPAGMFDDGYVLDSSRQTAGSNPAPDGRTWNWGYDSHTQIQGDSLLLSESYLRPGPGSHQLEDDLMSGFEVTYSRELFRAGRDESCLFGLEAAINYSALNIKSTWTQSLDLVRDTTTYQLGGVVPPYDPLTGQTYQGNHAGPGPIIPLTGTLSQISIPSVDSMTSHRELAANTYGFRLGPYFESPLYKNILGTVGTGLAIGLVDSDLSYVDTLHSSPRSGSATDFGTLVGWYVGGGLSYKWNQSWSVFYNAQYQWLPDYNLKAGETEARFKAGNALFQSIGIRYSF